VADRIPPPAARWPAEVLELVSAAVSDGDLEAALAQYEEGAALQPWASDRARPAAGIGAMLAALMELRLPLEAQVLAVLPAGEIVLVLGERRIDGHGPDGQRVDLRGSGATVVRRQPGGWWCIAADAWRLAGPGRLPQVSPSP
jgi:ketosteroid isomerase-like protein